MLLLASMDASQALSTIAQLALGLVGFTGVVIAVDQDKAEVSRVDAYRLNVLLYSSSGAMFLALLPLGLEFLNLTENDIWKLSNLGHAIFAFAFLMWFIPASRLTMQAAPEIFNFAVWRSYLAGHLANGILQILAVLGVANKQAIGIFIFGLFWLLFISLVQFRRMLLIHQRKNNGD